MPQQRVWFRLLFRRVRACATRNENAAPPFSPALNSTESHHLGCKTTTEARSLRPAAHLITAAMSANILRGRESSLGVSRGLRQMASVLNGLNPLPPDVEAAFVLG